MPNGNVPVPCRLGAKYNLHHAVDGGRCLYRPDRSRACSRFQRRLDKPDSLWIGGIDLNRFSTMGRLYAFLVGAYSGVAGFYRLHGNRHGQAYNW